MRCEEVEGGRDDEVKLKQDNLEALFSASELFKVGKVNLPARIKKENSSSYELRKWAGRFEWTVLSGWNLSIGGKGKCAGRRLWQARKGTSKMQCTGKRWEEGKDA
jgi:hypothetical protein